MTKASLAGALKGNSKYHGSFWCEALAQDNGLLTNIYTKKYLISCRWGQIWFVATWLSSIIGWTWDSTVCRSETKRPTRATTQGWWTGLNQHSECSDRNSLCNWRITHTSKYFNLFAVLVTFSLKHAWDSQRCGFETWTWKWNGISMWSSQTQKTMNPH